MKCIPYNPEHRQLWDDFVNQSKTPMFMFNRGFMEYHADRFEDFSLLFFDDTDRLIACFPATRQPNEIVSHGGLTYGGFITDSRMKQHTMLQCFDLLKAYCREFGIVSIDYKTIPHIYHHQPAQEDLYAMYRLGATTLKVEPSSVIELQCPIKMPKGRKAQISRARREGVSVEETTDFDAFIRLENEILAKYHQTKAVHSGAELALLHSRFPDNIKCIVGKLNQEIIAGTVLFIYDNVVHTQYMASNDKGREIGALDLVIKQVIDCYSANKRYLDFGISSEKMGTILNEGLIAQKESFGARTVVYTAYQLSTAP